ncbi:MAG TPA: TraB/GumN family protein [Paludibacteraceae bacterium]|nr:TraB/GumN family protein [Paludibacteraceae bacterium]
MNKKVILLGALLLFFSFTDAQLLWKISGHGLKKPSYLFGTHHLVPLAFLDSIPGLYKAFNASETVVGEMAVNNIDATSKIQKAAIMPAHLTIKDLLDEKQYQCVDSALKSVLRFGLNEMSVLNPTIILTLYQAELYKKMISYTDETAADSYFQIVAEEKGKNIIGLETLDKQMEILFGNGSLKRQAEILASSVLQTDSMMQEIVLMNSLYKKGDLQGLYSLSKRKNSAADMTDDEYIKLVDERNFEWLKQLPQLMKNSSCFIAVGALHLAGENGLVEQLRKMGYKVKPIEN